MTTHHKHHDCIVAWAKGAKIEYRKKSKTEWISLDYPDAVIGWHDHFEYRIKPEPKPDRTQRYQVEWPDGKVAPRWHQKATLNLALSFDGETGQLKSAEVI